MSVLDSDGFKLVTYKKSKKGYSSYLRDKCGELLCLNSNYNVPDNTKSIDKSKILCLQKDMEKSEFFISFIETVNCAIHKLSISLKEDLVDITCYGLGSFSSSLISQHQLALLLTLKQSLNIGQISIYDPVFSENEKNYLTEFGFDVMIVNEEAKRPVIHRTIFFMPHCDLPLYNNLLWSNWSQCRLSKIIVIGNSFSNYNRLTLVEIQKMGGYVDKANKYITEVKVLNNYTITHVFNDMAVHYFDKDSLSKFPASEWCNPREPDYSYSESELEGFRHATVLPIYDDG